MQWSHYSGLLDGWQAEWKFEEQRHNANPFHTGAEDERHATEITRLNAKARCMMGDQLAALDQILLKYRLW